MLGYKMLSLSPRISSWPATQTNEWQAHKRLKSAEVDDIDQKGWNSFEPLRREGFICQEMIKLDGYLIRYHT